MHQFDTGNTGFMLLATSLVMLMTPGLAFFYGGLVSRKNVLAIMIQSFVSMGVTTILWWAVGYTMCFSGGMANHTDLGGIIGNFHNAFLINVNIMDPTPINPGIPLFVFIAYQMMFAIITPALITGAFANRVRFAAYLWFLVGWLLFVYFPFVHMVWGGGLLQHFGVLDFAGGIVVHNIAGMAALASVFYVGRRRVIDPGLHSVPLVALGTGLLWFGWYGFNAGSEFGVDQVTAQAFMNTDTAASFGAVAWLIMAWAFEKKPKFVGLLTGAVAGLATITPAAGYVSINSAVLIGTLSGVVCYLAVNLKNMAKWDDALDVWGVHGVGGMLGIIMLGILGSKAVYPNATTVPWEGGLIHGGTRFFFVQLAAVIFSSIWAFVLTWVMLNVINLITPVKVSEAEQALGLDFTLHGEDAYVGDAEALAGPPQPTGKPLAAH